MTESPRNDDEHDTHLDQDEPPADQGRRTLTAREGRLKQWFLVEGNRLYVTAAVLVGVFLALLLATFLWPLGMQQLVEERAAAQRVFNSLLSGTILLVSIVVSINSIVLSQDLTSIGTQRDRVNNAVEFRKSVEELAGIDTSPTDPREFVETMVELLVENVEELDSTLEDHHDDRLREDARGFLLDVRTHAEYVANQIDSENPRSVDILLAGLSYDYASDTETARWLASHYEESLSEEELRAFERVGEALQQFAVSHEYFKSLLYMREFAKLSKTMLYVSLPVIVFTSYVIFAISSGAYPDIEFWELSSLTLLLVFAYSVALTPYVVLATFVLRSASIASRSLATGPFVMNSK